MNKTLFLKSAPLLLTASLALIGAGAAHAQVTIDYSLGGYAHTVAYGDASFNLASSPTTQNVTLTDGIAQTVNIQTVYFDVYPTTVNDDYTGSFSRTLTVNGVTQNAVQTYDLSTDYGDGVNTVDSTDSLIFYPGTTPLQFDLGSQGTLTFTPETLDSGGFFNYDSGDYVTNVKGKFLLTAPAAVPEASTTVSFGLLLAGLGLLAVRSRKRSAAQN